MTNEGKPESEIMTRVEEIKIAFGKRFHAPRKRVSNPTDIAVFCYSGFEQGVKWADSHPSDETIMQILNCIGYEERSWIKFVRKELERRTEYETR